MVDCQIEEVFELVDELLDRAYYKPHDDWSDDYRQGRKDVLRIMREYIRTITEYHEREPRREMEKYEQ